ncbi:MAG: DUF2239 family protein [Pseudomonadales bacterium]|jgi:hypothetical protein|nr:DUF2239 family protein [Pseudomonadales bacterium]
MSSGSTLAFTGGSLLARGDLARVALAVHDSEAHRRGELVLLIDADTGREFDIDLSGTREEIAARHASPDAPDADATAGGEAADAPRRRGRPRLGVVGREVTLLPRHWAWLEQQRGGASATLRRLVDAARKASEGGEARRRAQDRTQRLMSALAGDLPGFEEAARALYACDGTAFERETAAWPVDVRSVAREFAADAFAADA